MKQTDIQKAVLAVKSGIYENDKIEDLAMVLRNLPLNWVSRIVLRHREMIGRKTYVEKFFNYQNNISSVAPDVHDCVAAAVWLCNN